jgi:hypothetical protein
MKRYIKRKKIFFFKKKLLSAAATVDYNNRVARSHSSGLADQPIKSKFISRSKKLLSRSLKQKKASLCFSPL